MVELGEIRVRILKVGQFNDCPPSSFYLETNTPGKYDSFMPRWNENNECWEVTIPITQHNLDWIEERLFMKRGYLIELKRKEIRNPFHQAKQKKWFEEDMKRLEKELSEAEVQAEVHGEQEKNRQLMGELHAHSNNYYGQAAKAKEYGWPMPTRFDAMYDLEKGLGGYYTADLKFVEIEEKELAERHELQRAEDEELRKQGTF